VVIEPPGTSLLYLPQDTVSLKAANESADDRIVRRIQGIKDGLWQLPGPVQGVQIIRQRPGPQRA